MNGLAGVLAVFQTPYHDDESIDFETLQREIDWLFSRGVNGLVMAMVSEVLRLSSEERDELATRAVEFTQGRGPVVISVGAESSHTAVRHAQHAAEVGAAAVMAIPPVCIQPLADEILCYYRRLLAAVDLPVIVQDASGYVGQLLSLDLQAQLLAEYGADRVQFKPEAEPILPRLSELIEATGGAARVFEGSGGSELVDSFRRGIVGTMPGAEMIDGIVALWNALQANDMQRAAEIAAPIRALVALQSGLDGFLAVEKYLLQKQQVFRNTVVRGPRGTRLDEAARSEVDRLFARLTATVGT